jgi:xylose isomerase
MLEVLAAGGIGSGGLNFDAKVRRGSPDTVDLFHGHIGGMDGFARGLVIAAKIMEDGFLEDFRKERYSSWQLPAAQSVLAGKSGLAACQVFVEEHGEPELRSGRQEYLENMINTFI